MENKVYTVDELLANQNEVDWETVFKTQHFTDEEMKALLNPQCNHNNIFWNVVFSNPKLNGYLTNDDLSDIWVTWAIKNDVFELLFRYRQFSDEEIREMANAKRNRWFWRSMCYNDKILNCITVTQLIDNSSHVNWWEVMKRRTFTTEEANHLLANDNVWDCHWRSLCSNMSIVYAMTDGELCWAVDVDWELFFNTKTITDETWNYLLNHNEDKKFWDVVVKNPKLNCRLTIEDLLHNKHMWEYMNHDLLFKNRYFTEDEIKMLIMDDNGLMKFMASNSTIVNHIPITKLIQNQDCIKWQDVFANRLFTKDEVNELLDADVKHSDFWKYLLYNKTVLEHITIEQIENCYTLIDWNKKVITYMMHNSVKYAFNSDGLNRLLCLMLNSYETDRLMKEHLLTIFYGESFVIHTDFEQELFTADANYSGDTVKSGRQFCIMSLYTTDWFRFLVRLQKHFPNVKIVVSTTKDEDEYLSVLKFCINNDLRVDAINVDDYI